MSVHRLTDGPLGVGTEQSSSLVASPGREIATRNRFIASEQGTLRRIRGPRSGRSTGQASTTPPSPARLARTLTSRIRSRSPRCRRIDLRASARPAPAGRRIAQRRERGSERLTRKSQSARPGSLGRVVGASDAATAPMRERERRGRRPGSFLGSPRGPRLIYRAGWPAARSDGSPLLPRVAAKDGSHRCLPL